METYCPPALSRRHLPVILLLCLLLVGLAFFSFSTWEGDGQGELYTACAAVYRTLASSDAMAVFLGLPAGETPDTDRTREEEIRQKAQAYIAVYNEVYSTGEE